MHAIKLQFLKIPPFTVRQTKGKTKLAKNPFKVQNDANFYASIQSEKYITPIEIFIL